MATSEDIKKRALELSEKTDSNSISPKEVGGIMYDLASHVENAIRNGGTLGIRKVYTSIAEMEADKNPKDLWGNPLKKGNLVVIYDGTTTGIDNNKVYVYMNPGWEFATYLDAGYPTRQEFSELGQEVLSVGKTAIRIQDDLYPNIQPTLNNYYNGGSVEVGDVYTKSMSYSAGLACVKLDVSEGDVFIYYGSGTEYVRSFIVTDADNVVTQISEKDVKKGQIEINIGANDKTLYVSFNNYVSSVDYLKSIKGVSTEIQQLSKMTKELSGSVGLLEDTVNPKAELTLNNYYNGGNVKVGDVYTKSMTYVAGLACVKLDVSEGDVFIYYGSGTEYVRSFIVTDADNVVTQISEKDVKKGQIEINIGANDKTLYVSFNNYDSSVDYLRKLGGINESISKRVNSLEKKSDEMFDVFNPKLTLTLDNYYKGTNYQVGDVYKEGLSAYAGGACVKVRVNKGEHYIYNGKVSTYVLPYIITNSSGVITRIKPISDTEWGAFYADIEILDGETNLYCSFNKYDEKTDYLRAVKSISTDGESKPLEGKNIVCFGDSITEFSYQGKRVTDYLSELSGATVTNVAVGGTRLAQRTDNIPSEPNSEFTAYAAHDLTALISSVVSGDFSKLEYAANWLKNNVKDDNTLMVERLKGVDWSSVNAVTILIGTNDYAGGTQIGESGSESVRSIHGAINYVTKSILTKYPHLTVYWFTPVSRWMASTIDGRTDENWAGNKQNSIGKTLIDYCDAIIEECRAQGVPVCDTYRTIGWTKYNLGNYLLADGSDGVHPFLGFETIAKKMISFINANNVL